MTNHTPTPWNIESVAINALRARVFICDATGARVTDINCNDTDAAFIVRACNSHDALVKLAEKTLTEKSAVLSLAIKFSEANPENKSAKSSIQERRQEIESIASLLKLARGEG